MESLCQRPSILITLKSTLPQSNATAPPARRDLALMLSAGTPVMWNVAVAAARSCSVTSLGAMATRRLRVLQWDAMGLLEGVFIARW